jgi:hypothetical protein
MPYSIRIRYTNWEGKTSLRILLPILFYWGATKWHPSFQFLVVAYDYEKKSVRTFALRDFHEINRINPQNYIRLLRGVWKEKTRLLRNFKRGAAP